MDRRPSIYVLLMLGSKLNLIDGRIGNNLGICRCQRTVVLCLHWSSVRGNVYKSPHERVSRACDSMLVMKLKCLVVTPDVLDLSYVVR